MFPLQLFVHISSCTWSLKKTLYKFQSHKTFICTLGRGKEKERGKWERMEGQRKTETEGKNSSKKTRVSLDGTNQFEYAFTSEQVSYPPAHKWPFISSLFLSFASNFPQNERQGILAASLLCQFMPGYLKTSNNIHFIWPMGQIVQQLYYFR